MGLGFVIDVNENITFEFIKQNIDKPWNWETLSKHPQPYR